MDALVAGYHRFRAGQFADQRVRFRQLASQGQSPQALVVSCCDSRVDPQMIFDAGPGDLFVIRNVANLVPPYAPNADYHGTSAALEFGIDVLGISNLVVMGHGSCGGVRALRTRSSLEGDFIGGWMSIAQAAIGPDTSSDPENDDAQLAAELGVVRVSLENLMTFPFIRKRVAEGKLTLHGYYFALVNGGLRQYDAATNSWNSLGDEEAMSA